MNVPAKPQPYRLALPLGMEPPKWRVLTEIVFPSAKTPEAILLAVEYCRQRQLDILKRPVNIVSVWNSSLNRYVETIWPSISEAETTASRSAAWAGLDEPKFGGDITKKFTGRAKDDDGRWQDKTVELTFPSYCSITVHRLVAGQRYPFTERVYWLESYGRIGASVLPNMMWSKRPYGQLAKVAKAAALRAAFPEEEGGTPTDVEMEGQVVDQIVDEQPARAISHANVIEPATAQESTNARLETPPADNWIPPGEPLDPPHDPETGELVNKPRLLELNVTDNVVEGWPSWGHRFIDAVKTAATVAEVEQWQTLNEKILAACLDEAPKIHPHLIAAIGKRRIVLEAQ